MAKQQMSNAGKELIYLISSAIHNQKLDKNRVSEMNLENVYKAAKYHSIEAMIYDVLEKNGVFTDKEWKFAREWEKEKNFITYSALLLDIERQEILKFMEKRGIWYMPLKGIVLKEYYSQPDFRQMKDNDILFDENYRYDLYEFMVDRGYNAHAFEKNNHDVYLKSPVYNFEMHISLFGERHRDSWKNYYNKDIKSRLIKDDNNSYGYHLNDEDFYVYMITHANNHFIKEGIGIKFLIDIYLYVTKREETLDWQYIEQQTKYLEIFEFEKNIRELSLKVFKTTEENLKETDIQLLEYIISSGANGTKENFLKFQFEKIGDEEERKKLGFKVKYILRRVFPGVEFFKEHYPFVYRHKWLIPFAYIYRFFKGLFVRKKNPFKEFKMVWDKKK